MLGLDAAERARVQHGIAQGKLPALAQLEARGLFRELHSPAGAYAGGVWPSFYTGEQVADHGVFHNKLWRPETMRVEVPSGDWIDSRPLWEAPAHRDLEACVVDVPMLLARPQVATGLSGWATHDQLYRGSEPAGLWDELERRHGPPAMPPEAYGRQSPASLRTLVAGLERATAQLERIARELLRERPWRFACAVFGATHRAGHYLWEASPEADAELGRLYAGLDAALGRIVAEVGEDTLVVAFAVHGMAPNPGWSDLFPEILERLAAAAGEERPRRGLLYRLRRGLPFHWVRPLLARLPDGVDDALVKLWSQGMFDWSRTRWFPVPMDEAGYLRVNLRGREARGVVSPEDYESVCDGLAHWVASLRDADSGEPIAAEPLRAWRDADPAARHRDLLPDLVIPWREKRAAQVARLVSTALPAFDYAVPRQLPSGRSGNHSDRAWLLAAGPGAEALGGVGEVCELLPAVLDLLGPPARGQGA